MNSGKIELPPPPYNYTLAQPTNSFANPFSSDESSLIVLNKNEPKPILIENNNQPPFHVSCMECLECCTATMQLIYCCCVCIECLSLCK